MIYFDCKINFVDILISLIIVILTTGITYYLFSVLPSKRRLKTLKQRLLRFKKDIKEDVLKGENDFKQSYELYEEEEKRQSEGNTKETLFWALIYIKDWKKFIVRFQYCSLLDTYFHDYWQGRELMLIVNNLIMDDIKYIELSISLSKLSSKINEMNKILERFLNEKDINIWGVKDRDEIIKNKGENEIIRYIVESIVEIFDISHNIEKLINKMIE